jgi:hypothetical protein
MHIKAKMIEITEIFLRHERYCSNLLVILRQHNRNYFMITGKKLTTALLTTILLFTTGCGVTLTNLTPRSVNANPSRTYTMSVGVDARNHSIDRDTMQMYVVVDGERHPMVPSLVAPNVFEYDYKLPQNQDQARYFYVLDYHLMDHSQSQARQAVSDLQELNPVNTYVVLMETNRAPVGSLIALSGRGFTPTDKVLIGNVEADTEYQSPTAISFRVPALTAGRDYQVAVSTSGGIHDVGPFRVDASDIQVYPNALRVAVGERAMLVLTVPYAASSGGLDIDITTDIPASVALPSITIPEGASSINVPIEGLLPGRGILRIQARGFRSTDIPVWVE